jgi:hypothetical protein
MTTRRARFARGWIAAISHSSPRARMPAAGSLPATAGIAFSGATCVLLAVRPCRLPAPRPPSFSANFSPRPVQPASGCPSASTPAEAGMHHGAHVLRHLALRHPRCLRGTVDAVPLDMVRPCVRGPVFDPPVSRTSDPRDRSLNFRQARSDRPLSSTPFRLLL